MESLITFRVYPIVLNEISLNLGLLVDGIQRTALKKVQNLGYFLTELKGHLAWKEAKHKQACRLAEGIQDQHIANALRTRYL